MVTEWYIEPPKRNEALHMPGADEGAWANTHVPINFWNLTSLLEIPTASCLECQQVIMIITVMMVMVIIKTIINDNDNDDNKS